jgi:hypothetical protein
LKIPAGTYWIDGEKFRLVYGNPTKENGARQKLDGVLSPRKRLITIDASLRTNESERDETFWHEVMHGLDNKRKLGLSHKQVEALGRALAVFAKENRLEFA